MWSPAVVVSHHPSPRSYVVEAGGRRYRRNRSHLRNSTEAANSETDPQTQQPDDEEMQSGPAEPQESDVTKSPGNIGRPLLPENSQGTLPYCTRSGQAVKAPQKLDL